MYAIPLEMEGKTRKVIKIQEKIYEKCLRNTCHKRKGVILLKMNMENENITCKTPKNVF